MTTHAPKEAVFGNPRRLLFLLFFALVTLPASVTAQQANTVSAWDLIGLINGQRGGYGLSPLATDQALMNCAQSTAQTMADYQMSWHIGDVSGRVAQFGYNNGGRAYATENFATGPSTLDQIAAVWSDATHQIASSGGKYCHIGAGVAEANGVTYYVIQAAYPATGTGCGYSGSGSASGGSPGAGSGGTGAGGTGTLPVFDMSQIIASIKIAEPDADGNTYHVVQNGQSLWSIASAYGVKIEDVAAWNNIKDPAAIALNQKLLIPSAEMIANRTLPTTPAVVLPTMSADGKFRHEISAGETLWSIAESWSADFAELKRINGLTDETALGIGWKLFIPVTPTATSEPTLTALPTLVPTMTATADPLASTETAAEFIRAGTAAPTLKPTPEPSHLPKASMRTFMILGIVASIVVGAGIISYALTKQR